MGSVTGSGYSFHYDIHRNRQECQQHVDCASVRLDYLITTSHTELGVNKRYYYMTSSDSALRLVHYDHMTSQQFLLLSLRRKDLAFNGHTRLRCAVSRWNSKALVYHVIKQLMTGTSGNAQPVSLGLRPRETDCAVALRTSNQLYSILPPAFGWGTS